MAKPSSPHARSPGHSPVRRGLTTECIARAVIVRQGRLLTCWSVKGRYAYLPGGHVEFGEAAAVALARELMEELGVRVRVGPAFAVLECAFHTRKRVHHELNLLFHVELDSPRPDGPPPRSLEPGIEFHWKPLAELGAIDLRPGEIAGLVRTAARAKKKPKSILLTQRPWSGLTGQ